MSSNFLSQLKAKMRFFAPAEKRIAQTILSAPKHFTSVSLATFAEKAGVSQGSVINFAKKHGGGGFPKLKMQVALSAEDMGAESVLLAADSPFTVLEKTASINKAAAVLTCEANSEETLSRAVEWILAARRVEIYGIFRSAAVATDLCYQLLELGIAASFVSDILTCAISSTMLDAHDLVIAVSTSGRTKDVLDAVNHAKRQGVHVVALTSDPTSPIASAADAVLVACAGRAEGTLSEIRASQLLLVDALCNVIRSRLTEGEAERYGIVKTILKSHNVKEGEL